MQVKFLKCYKKVSEKLPSVEKGPTCLSGFQELIPCEKFQTLMLRFLCGSLGLNGVSCLVFNM